MKNKLKSYLITDPKYYSNNIEIFKTTLEKTIQKSDINYICFRDKESSNYKELAFVFVNACKENGIENIFLNSDYQLAFNLKACGVHLNSQQFDKIKTAKELGLKVIISCHNELDILKAKEENVDAITYSPIFNTPNKGKEKGIEDLKEIVNKYKDINIFALGGIVSQNHIKQINDTKAYGFASIRYFI